MDAATQSLAERPLKSLRALLGAIEAGVVQAGSEAGSEELARLFGGIDDPDQLIAARLRACTREGRRRARRDSNGVCPPPLLQAGGDGTSPLGLAALHGRKGWVRLLLRDATGCDPNVGKKTTAPIVMAAARGLSSRASE